MKLTPISQFLGYFRSIQIELLKGMAGKSKDMSQIKQLLRLHSEGKGKKTIAKILSMSKNTVKDYLHKLECLDSPTEELLLLDDPVLENVFFSGSPAYKNTRFDVLKEKFEYYVLELKKTGVGRLTLWEEYRQEHPTGYGYSQFCHHLSQYMKQKHPSMVLDHDPGSKLYIDFAGDKLSYIDRDTGEIIECNVFVACLPYSDYGFAIAVRTQSTNDFIYALEQCLQSLGGVPGYLVPDNLKAAIIKSDRYEPKLNKVLEDFANHYNTSVLPARVRKPQDKALVENHVKLVYSRVYAKIRNQTFFDLESLNSEIQKRMKLHNQTRMQQRSYCREEKFLSDEQPLLKSLPSQYFEVKYYKEHKVGANNHIFLNKHYYSVPYTYTGQNVKVIYTRSMVYVYSKNEQIAVHNRNDNVRRRYTTVKEHLCSHHKHYLDKCPEYYTKKAEECSAILGLIFEKIFEKAEYPELCYRTCDGYLALQRNCDPNKFRKACNIALEFKNYQLSFVKNIIENNMIDSETPNQEAPKLPNHSNIRGKQCYS